MRNVGIQCTIGPSCSDVQTLVNMFEAGMDAGRINLSHGSAASQAEKLESFRKAARMCGRDDAAVIYDLRGPEIRIKDMPGGEKVAADGDTLVLRCEGPVEFDEYGNEFGSYTDNIVRINYEDLWREVETGTGILIDDGKVRLTVESTSGKDITCYVEQGGVIAARKGVNAPDISLQMDYLGDRDREDILWCIENGADYIACSFIRRAGDVHTVREFLDSNGGHHIGLIAKIECKEALGNLEEIAQAADQILIARGDLGVEAGYEKVPALQKIITRRCREMGKAVIIATQLLDSMKKSPSPTRAEVSDVANAVFDGATDLMVTGETAEGYYPVRVAAEMNKIITQAERDLDRYGRDML